MLQFVVVLVAFAVHTATSDIERRTVVTGGDLPTRRIERSGEEYRSINEKSIKTMLAKAKGSEMKMNYEKLDNDDQPCAAFWIACGVSCPAFASQSPH